MKTFKTAIVAATTLTALTLATAPTAVALDASASIATSYLFRGEEMASGSPAVSADVSSSNNGLTYGVWVSSGDSQTEYDLYVDYSGTAGDIGYSIGYVDYNYATTPETSDLEEAYVGLSFGPASVTYYDEQDGDGKYTVFGYDLGAYSFAYGDNDTTTHFDVTYSVNDSLSLTVSKPEDEDAIVVASYSLPF
jgi:uncharacterized protein (TIGR02001 family)